MIQVIDSHLNQWDVGRSVGVTNSTATRVHFANQGDSKAVIIEIKNGEAKIPDYLLQTGKVLMVYAVLDGVTLEFNSFAVRKRPRPENYVYEDDQRNYIYALITNAENAIANANMAANSASEAAGSAILATENASKASVSANEAANSASQAAKTANEAAAKAAHTAKSLMVVGEAEGENISLTDAIDQFFVGCKLFGRSTQAGIPTPDVPVEIVSVGDSCSISVMVSGKNLLKTTANSTSNMNGVSFTVNSNGSITANGTATVDTYFTVNESVYVGSGEYYLTGCPAGGSGKSYFLYISGLVQDFGNGVRSRLSGIYKIGICIAKDSTVSNLTFYPMIRHVSVTDGVYEPYKGQALTLSTPNGLPGIPVTSGGNYTDANGQQWICDEIDFARGAYVQRIKAEVLDGSASFVLSSSGAFTLNRTDALEIDKSNQSAMVGIMCDAYPAKVWPAITALAQDGVALAWGKGVGIHDSNFETVGDFNDYLATNPITVQYILATPIETPLPAEELAAFTALHTYRGNTTVSNDASAHMEIEYVMDAKKYIDSLVGSSFVDTATVE